MKKQRDLFSPNSLEEDFQREFTAVISSTANTEIVKKKILPTARKIRRKLELRHTKKGAKKLIERLWKT